MAAFAYREFGLSLHSSKRDLVYSRLLKRLHALGMHRFHDYCDLLESADGRGEHDLVVSALTTNVTHFFREGHHFDLLANLVVKPRLAELKSGARLRIWSAGCSSGMEPYSIAMTLLDVLPEAAQQNIRILATDVDPAILARARAGLFSADEVKPIPDRMKSWGVQQAEGGQQQIASKVQKLVRFGELNLMQDWPLRGPLDAIFCRNVAIYFDKQTQARLWQRFASLLAPGGMLFIGHSERLSGPAEAGFSSVGITAYCKL
ncbi:protein-glutamate O-methyltransferase CheR [Xinfangfangia sp. CPCC 101601]|uniref:protein-glutamate O-methyltransferase n=1 Tax=Pseudogemmobacter lacusdianii TaxID=3069608 RepID=A0ABU0VZ53_9RHOB|nr:protein-glutamate O-methyltransferase CheR [Xinfangfangia sp. CPCC 101601]MDQ2067029.1 protein-glutamate O-methyltransferase CheR [Xinfangfangia sp. CPCC 101601]